MSDESSGSEPDTSGPRRPRVRGREDLILYERYNREGVFQLSQFTMYSDQDVLFIGQIDKRADDIELVEFENALRPVRDDCVFPELPIRTATNYDQERCYIKRPQPFKFGGVGKFVAERFFLEAKTLSMLARQEPRNRNIAYFEGVLARRGLIVGLVFRRYSHNLRLHLAMRLPVEIDGFMRQLRGAVTFIHAQGFAHNDIQPRNIMMKGDGGPALIDFSLCQPVGEELPTLTDEDWTGEKSDTSKFYHDTFACQEIEDWLRERADSERADSESRERTPPEPPLRLTYTTHRRNFPV